MPYLSTNTLKKEIQNNPKFNTLVKQIVKKPILEYKKKMVHCAKILKKHE